jgi:hypothetical protein
VEFVSDNGRERKTFDFAVLPGNEQVREDLVVAFTEAVGPLGSYRRVSSANGLWTTIRKVSRWLADNRPSLTGLAGLTVPDARMMLNAMRLPNGELPVAYARALFGYCTTVGDDVIRELARQPGRNQDGEARQPYTEQEWRWISSALRGIVRRARARITAHHQLVVDYRAGVFDGGPRAQRRCLGEVLDHYLRTGTLPESDAGSPSMTTRAAGEGVGRGRALKALVHLTAGETWAFAALLVGLTGLNSSTVFELPVPELRATSPDEPGILLVDAIKHRRGPMAAMTVPLAALPNQLHPPGSDRRPQRVLDTSLTTPFGVFTLLLELTASARTLTGSSLAFVFYNGKSDTQHNLVDGAAKNSPAQRRCWLREVLTGDPVRDAVLLGTHMNRLRRTHLERTRRPVAHTPITFNRYLRGMETVRLENFQIVREALDAQVDSALARRSMSVDTQEPALQTGQDTVLGACVDFQHSPRDGGRPCRQTFLTCLDCTNARAFPRHLPFQLAVLDALNQRRDHVTVQQWVTELAGRVAQLEQIVDEFEPAQREQARFQINDQHRHLAARLLAGDLDAS